MTGLYILVTVFLATFDAALSGSTTPPLATIQTGCVRDGVTYSSGQSFQPSPCEHCFCTGNGQIACAIADCFFTPCVDAIHDPKRCCPVCPNGENCKAPDGTIIKKGDTYQPDPLTTCSCPTRFGFGSPLALCAMQAVPVNPTLQVVS